MSFPQCYLIVCNTSRWRQEDNPNDKRSVITTEPRLRGGVQLGGCSLKRVADATRQILHRGDGQQADHDDQQGVLDQILPFYLFPHSLECVLKCAQHFASCPLPGPYQTTGYWP